MQNLPGSLDIARPGDGAVALLAGIGGTSKDDDALFIGRGALSLINARRMHQRIGIVDLIARSHGRGITAETHAADFRLGRIQPPAIHAFGKELVAHLLPVNLPSRRAERVIPLPLSRRKSIARDLRKHAADGIEFLAVLAAEIELRPHGNERVVMHLVQFLEHARRIRVALGIKQMRSPGIGSRRPVLPVLNDSIDGNFEFAQFCGHTQQLFLRCIALLALPETQFPLRHQRSVAGEMAVGFHGGGNGPVPVAEIIVNGLAEF